MILNLPDEVRELHSIKYGRKREPVSDEILVGRFMQTKNSAKERGIEFSLSLKRLRQLLNTKRCYYTGVELFQKTNLQIKNIPNSLSANYLTLERIDSTKGYTNDNVVAVAYSVNNFKGSLDAQHIIKIARKLEKMGYTSTGKRKKKK